MKRHKIRWAFDEVERLVIKAQALRDGGDLHGVADLLWEAQKTLPPDRQRPRLSLYNDKKLHIKISEALEHRKQQVVNAKAIASVVRVPEAQLVQTLEELLKLVAEVVADTIAKQLRLALLSRVGAVVLSAANAAASVQARVRKKRVIVVGPLDKQFAMLSNEFKELLDLRLFDKDNSPHQLGAMCVTADIVILWTDFISHGIQEIVPLEKRVLVSGGMDAIREKLGEIYVNA